MVEQADGPMPARRGRPGLLVPGVLLVALFLAVALYDYLDREPLGVGIDGERIYYQTWDYLALALPVGLIGVVLIILGLSLRRSATAPPVGAATAEQTFRLSDGREVLVMERSGTNGFAVASFVLGLIGLNLLGLIFGFVALSQIRRAPSQSGRSLAIAGIVLSFLWIAVFVGLTVVLASAG